MTGPVFVDTNVLVYARDESEPERRPVAKAWMSYLWRSRRGRLSMQVLQEFYSTVTMKLDPGLPEAEARSDVRRLVAWDPIPLDAVVLEGAWEVQDRFHLSWWDALIVSAAQVGGCTVLLTEDLQAGQDFGGLIVVNPFAGPPPGS